MPRKSFAPGIRAAGGVVWRVERGLIEIALVHRPRYDDWSLPKGKLFEGEKELAAAVREVGEELGSRVVVSRRIGTVRYDVQGEPKTVTYWVMRHVAGQFRPNSEVDEVRWLPPDEAIGTVSYSADRQVVEDFAAVPPPDSMILLVRHARAGKRSEWRGPDDERPLDPIGRAQAQRLVDVLAAFGPDRIVSAEPRRCMETVEPLADKLGLPIEVDPVFGDRAYCSAPNATEAALVSLAKPGHVTVVCSQGDAIPGLIDRLGRGVVDSNTRKAAAWALSFVDGYLVSTDYYEDAVR